MALQQLCGMAAIPLQVFSKANFATEIRSWLQQHQPDVVLVKTFPYKIPADALNVPKFGFINFHYAPLPAFRGSNPLFWMIRNGITEGGVTLHKMDETFDTGEILIRQQVILQPDTSFGMAVSQLAFTGATLTGPLLQGLLNSSLTPMDQDSSLAKWYGRPKPEDLFIRWNTMTATEIRNLVNACNPWNRGAVVRFRGWTFAITDSSVSDNTVADGTAPGTIISMDENIGVIVSCKGSEAIRINAIYTEEGYFSAFRLKTFGIQVGEKLDA